ncbi:histone-lysine N-methyltransferase SMYD3-like isoform X1 [Centruroides sculpturatus]|uniref:histone-lysine N-methyltransferase SMYD3-like isoform X1 n=2 Tax=Centruroides sculpturatus TaxID=218467 RepID=UPI000C6C89F7|nr:histone-lysine N-methyltransferase SMYD3-like isoform X1 [Centruroides sculpturatus]
MNFSSTKKQLKDLEIVINSFSILDSEMQAIGSGLFLGPSILDHSCDPNAAVTFDGRFLHVRAVRDIPSENIRDVFISYIDQMETKETKQQQLQEQYYFTCSCSRCFGDYWEISFLSLNLVNLLL